MGQEAVVTAPPLPDPDVVLVGTGPAGAAFLRAFRRTNSEARVLAIEAAPHPRVKVCGDALTFLSLPLLRELFPDVHLVPTRSFTNRYRFYLDAKRFIAGTDGQLDVIPRIELDAALWNSAAGDGVDVLDARVVDVTRDGSRVNGVLVEHNGAQRSVRAKLVVGADGSSSAVRRAVAIAPSRGGGVAIRCYYSGVGQDDGLVFVIDGERGGYLWIFPYDGPGARWANVGYFCPSDSGVHPKTGFAAMLKHPVVMKYLHGATRESAPVGFPLTLASLDGTRLGVTQPLHGLGYVLVGDAAGLIEPHTGEGISFALQSGAAAGRAAATSVDTDQWGAEYERDTLGFAQQAYPTAEFSMIFSMPHRLPAWLRPVHATLLCWWVNRRNRR